MELFTILRTASLLHDSARELTTLLDRHLAPYEVTTQQAALLVNLAAGETAPTRLATVLGTDTAGLTRLLDRLETKQLVRRRRSDTDRRAVIVELTEAGRRLAPQLVPTFGKAADQMFTGIAEPDIQQVGDVLARAIANLHPTDSQPASAARFTGPATNGHADLPDQPS
ncbi:MarR family winged helix-turn-helix transcriptional regulator [Nocardia sp. CA-129566]|uniref:MarR family winged helix-turn-helix transcriptional regulator n=1 Tax=Nocardia sp. CA-129566 TaxID=3239976 RepID=UPI003D9729D9